MSKVLRNDFVVRCTPEEAFEFLSDLRNELEWNPGLCQSVEKITDGPVGRGTKYRARWKGSPEIEVEYVEFEAPRRWKAHSGGAMESNFECTVGPHADGARVESELELIPHGLFKLAFPFFLVFLRKHEKAGAERMRRTLEARYGGAASDPGVETPGGQPGWKKWLGRLGVGVTVLVALVLVAAATVYAASRYEQSRSHDVQLAAIPVGESPDLAEGERLYLARGCGTADCHAEDGGGHVMVQDGPFGTITAANLTRVTRDYTGRDWDRAVRHGLRADGTSLVFMPSLDFVDMSDRELALIAGYVRSLPVVDRELPPTDVGFLARALGVAGMLPLFPGGMIDHAAVSEPDPEPGRTVEYGAYLAALCAGCHGEQFSGGPMPGAPPELGTPPNLTPHATGLAGWTEEEFREVLRNGRTPSGHRIDPVQMPWPTLGRMSDDEIGAVFMFLQSLPPVPEGNR